MIHILFNATQFKLANYLLEKIEQSVTKWRVTEGLSYENTGIIGIVCAERYINKKILIFRK